MIPKLPIMLSSLLLNLAFISGTMADTHWVCQNYSCVEVQGAGVNQCWSEDHCNTECSVDGVGSGDLYASDKCGACTGGACVGKKLGDECSVTVGVFGGSLAGEYSFAGKKKGKCGASWNCSMADPGNHNYEGACGMHCACDLAPNTMLEVCAGDPLCEGSLI